MRLYTRIFHILESIQYGSMYMFAAFFGGVGLDYVFPHFDESKPTGVILGETVGQCLCLIMTVYMLRWIIKSVPLLFPVPAGTHFVPFTTPEYSGEMMMGFVFLGSQLNLINKLDLLSKRFYGWLYSEERDTAKKIEKK
jgi:hypothetical protein